MNPHQRKADPAPAAGHPGCIRSRAIAVVVREHELAAALDQLGNKAAMVITDSQAFSMVGKITPDSIPLTSFSILMANYKGFLKTAVAGVSALKTFRTGTLFSSLRAVPTTASATTSAP